jgi:hypothetical protein
MKKLNSYLTKYEDVEGYNCDNFSIESANWMCVFGILVQELQIPKHHCWWLIVFFASCSTSSCWLSDWKKDKLGRGRSHPIQELTPPHGHSISLILGPPITTTFKLGQNPINLKPTISLQILKLHNEPTIDPSATAKPHVGIDT